MDFKSSRPKWPPRPQTFGLGLASISSYYVIGHFSGKNRVKFRNFVNFSANNLKSFVVNHIWCFFHILFLASTSVLASASRFWPHSTSLLPSQMGLDHGRDLKVNRHV